MTGPNGHREELELNANLSDALSASIDEAVGELKAETSFATMLVGMGDSVKAMVADLHKLENSYFASQQALKEDYLRDRREVEARLARIAKALGAR